MDNTQKFLISFILLSGVTMAFGFSNPKIALEISMVYLALIFTFGYIFRPKEEKTVTNHQQIRELLTEDEKHLLSWAIHSRQKELRNASANMGQSRADAQDDIEVLDKFYKECIHE
jgi:ABC-type transport system involved in cytochrome bd biosynthesis fused ATPase/permease subunit